LYVPLARHGDPQRICAVRDVHLLLQTLLNGLPRLGLLAETCQLVATIQTMERHRPEREGAITEFDRLFEIGYLAMVECVIVASDDSADGNVASDADLIEGLQWLSEPMLTRWLEHSRSLRLSVLEKLQQNKQRWPELVSFIERYGHDLFTPQFLNLGNLRAILHRGAGNWLSEMEAEREHTPDDELSLLVRELGTVIKREDAVAHLQLVLEALVEHYAEYKDYNSTTTQSDRGEMLHVLLDFLRLLSGYDRVAWNIRPLVMAHQALVRRGKMAAAELWRRALAQRTGDVADWHLKRLTELTKQYGVRLPTVADRLDERFVRPLAVDRIRALVRPAIEEKRRGDPPIAFELLEQEIDDFTEQPVGSGLDVPPWLLGLEEEADEALGARTDDDNRPEQLPIPRVHLTWAEVQSQLKSWEPG
jgi:hypothetical protein